MTLSVTLRHRFPSLTLDLAFEAPMGVTALFGKSGAGKSSVVNAVSGLLRPDAGQITVDGAVLLDTGAGIAVPPHRRKLGYVFQDPRLFPHLTVQQNLLYGRWFAGLPKGTEFGRIVDMLGLGPLLHRRPNGLSGGERQRVALGRALLSEPRLLLMDEPLSALDDARKAEILPYLETLRDAAQVPILYVSHSLSEIARLATTVVLMDAGRVTATGATGALLSDPSLATAIGLREAGAVLHARISAHEEDGLTRLQSAAGPLWLPQLNSPLGATVRLRILAQDVMLATQKPTAISALNILNTTVQDIRIGDGPGALVQLRAGDEMILARITRRSAQALGLSVGSPVFAILKAVSVAQENVGRGNEPL